MTFIKHTAISFLNKHHLRHSELNFKRLKKAANQDGYIVKKYSTSIPLIMKLGFYKRAKNSPAFSDTDENGNVLIFYDDSISAPKQLFALAHEIGHILLEHEPDKRNKKRQEREANLFAHYLIEGSAPPLIDKMSLSALIACLAAIIICVFVFLAALSDKDSNDQKGISDAVNNTPVALTTEESPSQRTNATENKIDSFVPNPEPSADIMTQKPQAITSEPLEETLCIIPEIPTETQGEPLEQPQAEDEQPLCCEPETEKSAAAEINNQNAVESTTTLYYWTSSGTVYHIDGNCTYLKNSKSVLATPPDQCPKERLCSRCGN